MPLTWAVGPGFCIARLLALLLSGCGTGVPPVNHAQDARGTFNSIN